MKLKDLNPILLSNSALLHTATRASLFPPQRPAITHSGPQSSPHPSLRIPRGPRFGVSSIEGVSQLRRRILEMFFKFIK